MSLRHRLAFVLGLVHFVGAATLVRSVLYDRWITVLASLVLLAGAAAARRGKTWGVGLTLGAAAAFPMAHALGMAPAWFWGVGLIGALPFALTSRSFARFDAKATAFGASLAIAVGLLAAFGWRVFAPTVIAAFPSLRPSFWPANETAAALTMATLMLVNWTGRRDAAIEADESTDELAYVPPSPALAAARVGVRVPDAAPSHDAAELALLDDDEMAAERRVVRGR
jgi:glucan phosphoethanolaminetransferase (alkaline phosphatase superfamily)